MSYCVYTCVHVYVYMYENKTYLFVYNIEQTSGMCSLYYRLHVPDVCYRDSLTFQCDVACMYLQNMHERLLEMGKSLPSTQSSTSTATARDTYTKEREKEGETFTKEGVSEGGGATTAQQGELIKREGRDTPDSTGQQGSYQILLTMLNPTTHTRTCKCTCTVVGH